MPGGTHEGMVPIAACGLLAVSPSGMPKHGQRMRLV